MKRNTIYYKGYWGDSLTHGEFPSLPVFIPIWYKILGIEVIAIGFRVIIGERKSKKPFIDFLKSYIRGNFPERLGTILAKEGEEKALIVLIAR